MLKRDRMEDREEANALEFTVRQPGALETVSNMLIADDMLGETATETRNRFREAKSWLERRQHELGAGRNGFAR